MGRKQKTGSDALRKARMAGDQLVIARNNLIRKKINPKYTWQIYQIRQNGAGVEVVMGKKVKTIPPTLMIYRPAKKGWIVPRDEFFRVTAM